MSVKKYTAIYQYGDDGWWTVHIKEVRGAHTQGRNIAQARRRVREALSLFVDDADTAELVDDLRLGPELRRALRRMIAARHAAARQQQIASTLSKKVAKALAKRMSVRDAGEVLGISYQRAQQLASS